MASLNHLCSYTKDISFASFVNVYKFVSLRNCLLIRYGRVDVMPLGKFSLNLTHCPSTEEYGQLVHTFIQALVTKVGLQHLYIDTECRLP